MFSAKPTNWKQLATTSQYLRTAPSQHCDGFLHNHCLCCVGPTCLVAYLARSMDRRCTQPDWDAAVEQFSLLLFLWLLSDKRGAEIIQNLHAPDRGTDQQNRRSTAELEQHSTAGHVCLRGNLPNICCLLKQRLNCRQASVDIVKRHFQSAVDMSPERPD